MRVKICGITQLQQGIAIAQLGATDLGFMCVPSSPRYVTPEQIQAIVQQLPRSPSGYSVNRVGVFVDTTIEEIGQIVAIGDLNAVQLHGNESPEFCQALRSHLPHVEVIKAFRVRHVTMLDQVSLYTEVVDTFLLDAYHPKLLGGTGHTLDWQSLQTFRSPLPWLLAGGLNPDNVRLAIRQAHPDGIDLSSGVEHAPGDKDLARVKRLFDQLCITL